MVLAWGDLNPHTSCSFNWLYPFELQAVKTGRLAPGESILEQLHSLGLFVLASPADGYNGEAINPPGHNGFLSH